MLEEDLEKWQEMMKELMVLKEDFADFQKRLFKLYKKVDEKLDRKET